MPVLYHNTLAGFRNDISAERIASAIKTSGYEDEVGKLPSSEEEESWQNSLGALCKALDGLDGGLDVYAEYVIPPESYYRADFMITGFDSSEKKTAVIIELKQWSNGSIYRQDGQSDYTVHATWDDEDKDHPSHQVYRYAHHLKTHCTSVRDKEINIFTCVFLHNYDRSAGVVEDPVFAAAIKKAPIYYNDFKDSSDQGESLAEFISDHISSPDSGRTVAELEDPNHHIMDPKLVDTVFATLEKGTGFELNAEKWPVYSKMKDAYERNRKTVVVISGAPGTGKTVLAIRLMGHFRHNGLGVRYVTLSQNLRYLFIDKLCSDHLEIEREKGHMLTPEEKEDFRLGANEMFSPPYFHRESLFKEVSIVDEAHRLQKMEQDSFNRRHFDNRAEYIIENSTLSVFLIDDDQQVRWEDYCTKAIIEDYASRKGYQFIPFHLEEGVRQYTPYIDWATALFSPTPVTLKMNPAKFLVRVCDKASELYSEIVRLNRKGSRSRMLAGYCWAWKTRGKNKAYIRQTDRDISLLDRDGNPDLQLIWNLFLNKDDFGGTWIGRDDSIDEVGCIHTAQGVDMDYVGVIIGEDVTYNKSAGRVEFHVDKHPADDFSVTIDKDTNTKVDSQNAERLIRNAYRVLMTRSTKGCLIYCVDKDLSDYIKAHLR